MQRTFVDLVLHRIDNFFIAKNIDIIIIIEGKIPSPHANSRTHLVGASASPSSDIGGIQQLSRDIGVI